MYKSMYDILNKSINYKNEYEKLWNMIFNEECYKYCYKEYSLTDMFNKFIVDWKYKGTKCTAEEVLEELKIVESPNLSPQEAVLRLCDFIVNVREFIIFEKNKIDKIVDKIEQKNINSTYYGNYSKAEKVPSRIIILDKIIIDLVYEILNSLNYEVIKKENYQCFIVKKNVDSEETAKVVEDENISTKILEYNNYTIADNVETKKDILKSLADYFEGIRKEIKSCNASLENNISFALNNFNIRHNNITGKNENTFVKNVSKNELIKLYNKTYFLMLIAFRLIALKEFEEEIEDIKQNEFSK